MVREQAERVMRSGQVGIEVARFDEVPMRTLEIASVHLDETEVHPAFRETRVVLERERYARLGPLKVAGRHGRRALPIELDRLGRERSGVRARSEHPQTEREDD